MQRPYIFNPNPKNHVIEVKNFKSGLLNSLFLRQKCKYVMDIPKIAILSIIDTIFIYPPTISKIVSTIAIIIRVQGNIYLISGI